VEVGNTIPSLLDRFVVSPEEVENTLPLFGARVIYRPYLRAVVDLRRYAPVSRLTTLATKLYAGVAHPTGRPDVVPFDRRFYAGGATSVRGWRLRELGPGATTLASTGGSADGTNILGGDIKLEASAEVRTVLLREIVAADWQVATFVDVGNVWFGPRNPGDEAGRFAFGSFYRQLGMGGGGGLRILWNYLIARLDVAYRLHDPLPGAGSVFTDGLGAPTLHFGIGHAF
jgi:outer membrane protein assembly factor BamA